MSNISYQNGQWGEDQSVEYLKKIDYTIIERNFRCALGEIDVIAKDQETLCFVEVRSRQKDDVHPLESINDTKRRKLIKTATYYLLSSRVDYQAIRFDVVSIVMNEDRSFAIDLIKDAFETDESLED